jgi:hypothetical protein
VTQNETKIGEDNHLGLIKEQKQTNRPSEAYKYALRRKSLVIIEDLPVYFLQSVTAEEVSTYGCEIRRSDDTTPLFIFRPTFDTEHLISYFMTMPKVRLSSFDLVVVQVLPLLSFSKQFHVAAFSSSLRYFRSLLHNNDYVKMTD